MQENTTKSEKPIRRFVAWSDDIREAMSLVSQTAKAFPDVNQGMDLPPTIVFQENSDRDSIYLHYANNIFSVRTPIKVSRIPEEEINPEDSSIFSGNMTLHIHKPQDSFPDNNQFFLDFTKDTTHIHNQESYHCFQNPDKDPDQEIQKKFQDLENNQSFQKIAECRTDEFLDMLKLSKYGIPDKNNFHTENLYTCRMHIHQGKIASAAADGRRIARITSSITQDMQNNAKNLEPIHIPPDTIENLRKIFFSKKDVRERITLYLSSDKRYLGILTADGTAVLINLLYQESYPNLEATLDRDNAPDLKLSANRKDLIQTLKNINTVAGKEQTNVDLALNLTTQNLDFILKSEISSGKSSCKVQILENPKNIMLDTGIAMQDFQNVLEQGTSEEVELNFYSYGINTLVLGIHETLIRSEKIQKEIEEISKDNTVQTKQVTEQVPIYSLEAKYIIMLHRSMHKNVATPAEKTAEKEESQSQNEDEDENEDEDSTLQNSSDPSWVEEEPKSEPSPFSGSASSE